MRHVPIAEFKDKLSEVVAAAAPGEDIVITRHGRDLVRLVGIEDDHMASQRKAIDDLLALRTSLYDAGVRVSQGEIRERANEGRRYL